MCLRVARAVWGRRFAVVGAVGLLAVGAAGGYLANNGPAGTAGLEGLRQRVQLERRASSLDEQLAVVETARDMLAAERDDLDRRLQQTLLTGSRRMDAIASERDRARERIAVLQGRVELLESRLSTLTKTQGAMVSQLDDRAKRQIGSLERALARAGVNVQKLLRGNGAPAGQVGALAPGEGLGGPMLPPAVHEHEEDPIDRLAFRLDRWNALNRAMERLPLTAPLASYRLGSDFGNRRDPLTGRSAFHSGLDLNVPRNTPVMATAPGKVIAAGRQGPYGNMVEIDHGFGVTTRYAHLSRTKVRPGQTVKRGETVGLAGSTGRTTGVHVHYEVTVDGTPRDPARFLEVGRQLGRN